MEIRVVYPGRYITGMGAQDSGVKGTSGAGVKVIRNKNGNRDLRLPGFYDSTQNISHEKFMKIYPIMARMRCHCNSLNWRPT